MTAYEIRFIEWSSDVCSSNLVALDRLAAGHRSPAARADERRSGRHLDIVRADDDLGGAVVHVEDGPAAIALHHQMIDGDDERLARAFYRHDRKMIGVADPPDLDRIEADEPRRADSRPQDIGRAACRARVCQYGST